MNPISVFDYVEKLSFEDAESVALHLQDRARNGPPMSSFEAGIWLQVGASAHGGYIIRDDNRDPYLLRMYLTPHTPDVVGQPVTERKVPALYAHYFFRGDGDREFHSHPWPWSGSFVLTAGYTEHRCDRKTGHVSSRIIKPFRFNYLSSDTLHRVTLHNGPAWTLFLAGTRVPGVERGRDWGFFNNATREFEFWGDRDKRKARERNGRV